MIFLLFGFHLRVFGLAASSRKRNCLTRKLEGRASFERIFWDLNERNSILCLQLDDDQFKLCQLGWVGISSDLIWWNFNEFLFGLVEGCVRRKWKSNQSEPELIHLYGSVCKTFCISIRFDNYKSSTYPKCCSIFSIKFQSINRGKIDLVILLLAYKSWQIQRCKPEKPLDVQKIRWKNLDLVWCHHNVTTCSVCS